MALYAAIKFVLLVFTATDSTDRWIFELTPGFLLGLPDLPLLFLSLAAAVAEAYLQSVLTRIHRLFGMLLAGSMAVGLIVSLETAAGADPANLSRLLAAFLFLGIVGLDHLDYLAHRPVADLKELEEIAEEIEPLRALEELGELVEPEGASRSTAAKVKELLASIFGEEGLSNEVPSPTEAPLPHRTAEEEELEEEMLFTLEDLGAFEQWLALEKEAPPLTKTDEPRVDEFESLAEMKLFLAEARRLIAAGRFDKALEVIDQIAELDPQHPGLLRLREEIRKRASPP